SGPSPPAVTQSGTIPVGLGLRVECNVTGGARGPGGAKFRYSTDNGTTWEGGGSGTQFDTAPTFNLNPPFAAVQLQFSFAAYSVGNAWELKISSWRDQINGHHFI